MRLWVTILLDIHHREYKLFVVLYLIVLYAALCYPTHLFSVGKVTDKQDGGFTSHYITLNWLLISLTFLHYVLNKYITYFISPIST